MGLKKFDFEKENVKIKLKNLVKKHSTKMYVIFLLCIVFIVGIYFTYSKFLVTSNDKIVDTTVNDFNLSDYYLSAVIDGEESSNIPSKTDGYVFEKAVCDNGATGEWNNVKWAFIIGNATKRTKCTVYFVTGDPSGAAAPDLVNGMVPVTYNETGATVVADRSKWYDYNSHKWANAVLVNSDTYRTASAGTVIPEANILQYYVWIPRYKYLLWNAENNSSTEQMIDIKFEDKETPKSTGSTNGTWLTHPAFTFGDEELNGIWVGKFENSTSDASCQGASETESTCNKSTLPVTIKPNQSSWNYINVSNQFVAIQGIGTTNATSFGLTSSEVDTHMMKNMEWGAVAYLTSSIYGRYTSASTCIDSGCEVWINNVRNNSSNYATTTGCAGASVSATMVTSATCPSGYDWTTQGINASTTGNQYGIYDMSGGSWEYVMGNMVDSSGNFYPSNSGFGAAPDAKYYDSYAYGTSYTEHARGHLGDATKETLKTYGNAYGGWYGDYAYLPYSSYSWFIRGGHMNLGSGAGVFYFSYNYGDAYNINSSRVVAVAH